MPSSIVDPPAYWRSQLRKLLAAGGDIEALDPLLEVTGPPDVYLEGVSTDARSVLVKRVIPTFEAHTWTTRMWTCLRLDLASVVGNSLEAKPIPTKGTIKYEACPHCGGSVPHKVPGRTLARLVVPSHVRTFQRRMRAASRDLELPPITGPVHIYFRPGRTRSFAAWRPLTTPFEITTDSRADLDNLVKAFLDGMQAEHGRPGLLRNDKLGHLLTLGRTMTHHPQGE